MINKPHGKDHYTYVNELLNLENDKQLGPETEIDKGVIDQVEEELKKLQEEKNKASNAEIEANIIKMQRVLEVLRDEEKRKAYNAQLASLPSVQVNVQGETTNRVNIVPLVSIDEIIAEFNAFSTEMIGKDMPGGGQYKEGDFQYRKEPGPPTVHIFSFPDSQSADAFIERLFNKNMAMLPNGSQSMDDVRRLRAQQALKEELVDIKSSQNPEEPSPSDSSRPSM